MLIDGAYLEETRVVICNEEEIDDFDHETKSRQQVRGNLYLAKVARVEPSLQAAFVDYGKEKHGFLSFSEIHPDYFQIPVADRKLLLQREKDLTEKFSPKDPNTGKLKKITIGAWILPIFKMLSKFKFLRGTLLDPFGKTKERKMERFLINQYKKDLDKILSELNSKNISLAVQIASIPEMIRGYGHVKEENIKKAERKREELLEIWNSKEDGPISAIAAE